MKNNKKIESTENLKKTDSNLKGIFPNTKIKQDDISLDHWIESINSLKEKKFTKLSVAVDAVVDEVVIKLNIKPTSDLRVFLHDLCTDSPKIMECIEKELIHSYKF